MKTLTIVRHAKSSWDDPALSDRDRPLNPRGLRNAPTMGQRIAKMNIRPEKIISSPAVRAWHTATIIAEVISYPTETLIPAQQLYHATVTEILGVISELGEGSNHLMIVGHNPGLTDFVNTLSPGLTDNLPTAGVVTARIDQNHWDLSNAFSAEVLWHNYPKKPQND